ncbi:hypothetical protein Bca4012_037866 [Brassica carinata]
MDWLQRRLKALTSTVGMKDETKGGMVQKAKIEIVLGKSDKFDSLVPPVQRHNSRGGS